MKSARWKLGQSHRGTHGRYVAGCRCPKCTRANTRYWRAYRRAHKIRIMANPAQKD